MRVKILILLIFSVIITACDVIEEPYTKPVDNNGNGEEVLQKVLLEEFTGHQCPNCPAAAKEASDLHDYYGDRFIIIAYHAGWFARTTADFPTDYRTAIGEEFNSFFQVTSYPKGMINRKLYNSSLLLNPLDWGSAIESIVYNEPRVRLDITKTYIPTNRFLTVNATVKSLTDVNPLNVSVFVTESNLVSPQKVSGDSNYPDGLIPEYVHNHVFRGSLNGAWGSSAFSQGVGANRTETITVSGTLNESWIPENIEIVCFAYDASTGEVIQVEKIKLN